MYNKGKDIVLKELNTNLEEGPTEEEVIKRQKEGKNELIETKPKPLFLKILDQLNEPMVYILAVAAGISAFMKEISDAIIILVVIIINTVVGLVQEDKAQKSLDALKKLSVPKTLVKRDGTLMEIPVEELVVGDVVIIEAGRYIPADLRLVEVVDLKIDESILTGKSFRWKKWMVLLMGKTCGDLKICLYVQLCYIW